jgi:hypothetical protein
VIGDSADTLVEFPQPAGYFLVFAGEAESFVQVGGSFGLFDGGAEAALLLF